jgi:hypothetical protein
VNCTNSAKLDINEQIRIEPEKAAKLQHLNDAFGIGEIPVKLKITSTSGLFASSTIVQLGLKGLVSRTSKERA